MAVSLNQYTLVRIRQLLRRPEEYDGWRLNQRAPQVGDTGTIIDILHSAGLPDHYVVESAGPDGIPVFLGEFLAEELVAVDDILGPSTSRDPQVGDHGRNGPLHGLRSVKSRA